VNESNCVSENPSGRETLISGDLSVMVVIVLVVRLVTLVLVKRGVLRIAEEEVELCLRLSMAGKNDLVL
jgi:hypothetical protein